MWNPKHAFEGQHVTVLMDNDGHMDDLIALIVLSQLVGPSLSSVVISQGNSEIDIAAKTTATLLNYMAQKGVLIGVSERPAKNMFLDAWRAMSKDFHTVVERFAGEIETIPPTPVQEAHEKWINELQTSDTGLIVATGPLTNISNLLDNLPHNLANKVKLYWMGGALDVTGNVTANNGTPILAEWNSYADSDSVAKLLAAGIEVFIVPLDVTNHFEVTNEMIRRFRSVGTVLAEVVAALLEYSASKYNYYLWDPIASVLAIHPHLAHWETLRLSVETDGKNEGRIFRSDKGNICHVATHIQRDQTVDVMCKCLEK